MKAYVVFAPVFFCGLLQAQVAGWNRVEVLPPGARLVITTHRRAFDCTFRAANEEGVYCDSFGGGIPIPRTRIAKIAVLRPQKAIVIGTTLGAAAGGVAEGLGNSAGAANVRTLRTILASVVGGFAGNLVGRVIGRSASDTIYVQP